MGFIDVGQRLARNAWRIPGVGQVLALDYERSFARRPPNRFRGVYGSFPEAEASIPPGEPVGYDHAELAGLYRHRMVKANDGDYPVLFWLRASALELVRLGKGALRRGGSPAPTPKAPDSPGGTE